MIRRIKIRLKFIRKIHGKGEETTAVNLGDSWLGLNIPNGSMTRPRMGVGESEKV